LAGNAGIRSHFQGWHDTCRGILARYLQCRLITHGRNTVTRNADKGWRIPAKKADRHAAMHIQPDRAESHTMDWADRAESHSTVRNRTPCGIKQYRAESHTIGSCKDWGAWGERRARPCIYPHSHFPPIFSDSQLNHCGAIHALLAHV
jgi:hypothetical protein